MKLQKLLPLGRSALLSTIAFWGYYFITTCINGLVSIFYSNDDTEVNGYPDSYFTVCLVVAAIAFFFFCLDTCFANFGKRAAYIEKSKEKESFFFGKELASMLADIELWVLIAVFSFWNLIIFDVWAFLITLAYLLVSDFFARLNWFAYSREGAKIPESKGFTAVRMAIHVAIWFAVIGLLCVLSLIGRELFGAIFAAVGVYLFVALGALVGLLVLLFIWRRIRALSVQRRFFKKLAKACRENSVRYKEPKGIYKAVLRQQIMQFTLEHKNVRFNCVLIPTILRKTPLYFLGKGEVKRVHTFYFFKIELFSSEKILKYQLERPQKDEKNVIILSPIPREFFIGERGNAASGDFNSEVDKALIYSGSEFCNYIERVISENRVYDKEGK
ncbi:MAG: hypothetical protein IKY21_02510 [Clostridia bacterium]|nr:hypothetical protein [Clostridia bacterium]